MARFTARVAPLTENLSTFSIWPDDPQDMLTVGQLAHIEQQIQDSHWQNKPGDYTVVVAHGIVAIGRKISA